MRYIPLTHIWASLKRGTCSARMKPEGIYLQGYATEARVSLLVAVGATVLGGVIGVALGLISGYAGGVVDAVIMRCMDGVMAFPFILLSIILMTVLGDGIFNVILAIGIAVVPRFSRVVRGQVLIVKKEEYCNAGRVIGISNTRMLLHHILPNTVSEVIVYATLNTASAIISEASLSFLGLGIKLPTASWGSILRSGRDCLNTAPHHRRYRQACLYFADSYRL
mgnify:FL=1